jgi:hypothetical protein
VQRLPSFFTGQMQRILDTAGQVDRFQKRAERAEQLRVQAQERDQARTARERARTLVEVVDEAGDVEPIEGIGGGDRS